MPTSRLETQRGATLFVAICMILLLTLLALTAMRITSAQQGGVAAMAFAAQAMQSAESAARAAEAQLAAAPAETLCDLGGTVPVMRAARARNDRSTFLRWDQWPTLASGLADYTVLAPADPDVATTLPRVYFVEAAGFTADAAGEYGAGADPTAYGAAGGGLTGCGSGSSRGIAYYRIVSRATGPEDTFPNGQPATQAIVETTYARRR